jgi:hypothetical protein
LFVDKFISRRNEVPRRLILDLDATDDPLHGEQKVASFMDTTTAIATCHCTSSVAANFCVPN